MKLSFQSKMARRRIPIVLGDVGPSPGRLPAAIQVGGALWLHLAVIPRTAELFFITTLVPSWRSVTFLWISKVCHSSPLTNEVLRVLLWIFTYGIFNVCDVNNIYIHSFHSFIPSYAASNCRYSLVTTRPGEGGEIRETIHSVASETEWSLLNKQKQKPVEKHQKPKVPWWITQTGQ